jgi:sugar lactone lactonase YvrE
MSGEGGQISGHPRNLGWRQTVVAAIALLGLLAVTPTIAGAVPRSSISHAPGAKHKLLGSKSTRRVSRSENTGTLRPNKAAGSSIAAKRGHSSRRVSNVRSAGGSVSGNDLYIANQNDSNPKDSSVVEISASGSQATLPATGLEGPAGVAVDSAGDVYVADSDTSQVLKISPSGVQSTVPATGIAPLGVAVDSAGDIYIADGYNSRVVKITPAGVQSTVPTSGLGIASAVAVDSSGDVFIADSSNNQVLKVTPAGVQSTLPATGLSSPNGIAVDNAGNVYISDRNNDRIVELTTSGTQTVVPTTGLGVPGGVAVDSTGDLYISDATHGDVLEVTPSGTQTVIPTTGLSAPVGLAVVPASPSPPGWVTVSGPSSVAPGSTYTATATANGDPGPPTFKLATSPAAPTGLTINANSGAISYSVPSGITSFSFAVVATNTEGSATSPTATIGVVTGTPTAPTNVTVTGPSVVVAGGTYSATASADGNPAPTFALASTPTPPTGLTINASTGAVSYQVPSGGDYFAFGIVATNIEGTATTDTYVSVGTAPTLITVASPPSVNAGSTYTAYVEYANGTPVANTITLGTSPTPPSGMTIVQTFIGESIQYAVPVSGVTSFSYSVVASNGVGSTTSTPVTVTVDPPLQVPTAVTVTGPASATGGSNYSATASAGGYPAPVYTLADSPVPPAALTLNSSTGAISYAVPAGISSFSYAVVATNSEGASTSPTETVTVPNSPPASVSVNGTAAINAGNTYTATAGAEGSPAPTFSLAPVPAPPSGMTVNSASGFITYPVPQTASTSFSFAIVATNDKGSATSTTVTIAVDPVLVPPAKPAPCLQPDLQTAIDAGGVLDFVGDCTLNLTTPLLVPAGVAITISGNGHAVVLDGLNPNTGMKGQVISVTGGALTLNDVFVTNGYADGRDGTNGGVGAAGSFACGSPGGDATSPGGNGTAGIAGQGGGLYIAAQSKVTVTKVDFSNDDASGGIGGSGGAGGNGGNGGSCSGPVGYSGGNASNGGNAAAGGSGQGGAIFNAGSLTVTDSMFSSDVASGGTGGSAGPGGTGGSGGFLDTNYVFAGNGGTGGVAGKSANGGAAQGGAIYSTGKLSVSSSSFNADGANAGLGGSGNSCELGVPSIEGCTPGQFGSVEDQALTGGGYGGNAGFSCCEDKDLGNGGDGGKAGNGGNGGNAAGGAVWSSPQASLSGLTYSADFVGAGHAPADCPNAPQTAGCGGLGGVGGVGAYYGHYGAYGQNGKNGTGGNATNVDVYSSSSKALAIKTTSLTKGKIGATYSKNLSATGGSAPYNWTVFGLPTGLTATTGGAISGVPLAVGTFEVSATVTDSSANSVSTTLALTIKGAKPKVTLQPANSKVLVGASVIFHSAATGAPTPTLQWEVSTDGGKEFSAVPGQTSATLSLTSVTASQNGYRYRAEFSNSAGTATSKKAKLTVTYPTPVFTSAPSASGTPDIPFSFAVEASNSLSLTETGKLPSGIEFSTTGSGRALLSGTPVSGSAGVYKIKFTAINAGSKVKQSFVLTIT